MTALPGGGVETRKGLFTGANLYSRVFEAVVTAAALILGAAAVVRLPDSTWPAHPWQVSVVTALTGCAAIIGGGLSVIDIGQKTSLNFGGAAALAAVLALPARFAFPASFAGTLVTQLIRRARGERLTFQTIIFNQSQRVAGWAVADLLYVRLRTDPALAGVDLWAPILAAAATYWLFNTWALASWSALRRRGSAWDLWSRKVQDLGPAYLIEYGAVVAAARVCAVYPVAAMAGLWVAGVAYVMVLRGIGVLHQRQGGPLRTGVNESKRRSAARIGRAERSAWASMGIPIEVDAADDSSPAPADVKSPSRPSDGEQKQLLR